MSPNQNSELFTENRLRRVSQSVLARMIFTWIGLSTLSFFAILYSGIGEVLLQKLQSAPMQDIFTDGPWTGWYVRNMLSIGLTRLEIVSISLAVPIGLVYTAILFLMSAAWKAFIFASALIFYVLNGTLSPPREIWMSICKSILLIGFLGLLSYSETAIMRLFSPILLVVTASVILGVWRLSKPPKTEFFTSAARHELALAWQESKTLATALLLVLCFGTPIIASAHKDAPIVALIVALIGASVLIGFVIKVYNRVAAAFAIARNRVEP